MDRLSALVETTNRQTDTHTDGQILCSDICLYFYFEVGRGYGVKGNGSERWTGLVSGPKVIHTACQWHDSVHFGMLWVTCAHLHYLGHHPLADIRGGGQLL